MTQPRQRIEDMTEEHRRWYELALRAREDRAHGGPGRVADATHVAHAATIHTAQPGQGVVSVCQIHGQDVANERVARLGGTSFLVFPDGPDYFVG